MHCGATQVYVDVTAKSGLARASYVFNKQQVRLSTQPSIASTAVHLNAWACTGAAASQQAWRVLSSYEGRACHTTLCVGPACGG